MECECAICKTNKPFEMPKEIVEAAIKENLVLFCGAGISTESKTVLPYSFYSSILDELGVKDNTISFSNLMQKFCDQPNGRKKLLKKIRDRFKYIHSFPEIERQATAFHQELAEIYPIRTIITTNWDTYFEQYCGAVPITIPEDFAFWDDQSRAVLKIHGSIDNLSSIIATTEDYTKCYMQLQNGIIGATLKSLLGTKTVVFIGFSFGDEDFAQIMDYLRNEMGELFPHIYLVTLDDSLHERLEYKNSTAIITSGTFFLHTLKKELIDKGVIVNSTSRYLVYPALERMLEVHGEVSEIDIKKYPCAIYSIAYQDGVIHAWERFLQDNTGEYNVKGYVSRVAMNYYEGANEYRKDGDFWNMSYYEGYANGLMYISACDIDPDAFSGFPLFYIPNSRTELSSLEVFMGELERINTIKSKYVTYARKAVKDKAGEGIVFHRPPY